MDLPDISLDFLLARTREEDGHLIWTGHANSGKFPQTRINYVLYPVRRLLFGLVYPRLLSDAQVGVRCDYELCVHPDCLVQRCKAKVMKGKPLSPERKIRIALSRRKSSKLTIDQVREIRASDLSGVEIEKQYGLKPGYASRIRLGIVWQDHSNPFSGLGAR